MLYDYHCSLMKSNACCSQLLLCFPKPEMLIFFPILLNIIDSLSKFFLLMLLLENANSFPHSHSLLSFDLSSTSETMSKNLQVSWWKISSSSVNVPGGFYHFELLFVFIFVVCYYVLKCGLIYASIPLSFVLVLLFVLFIFFVRTPNMRFNPQWFFSLSLYSLQYVLFRKLIVTFSAIGLRLLVNDKTLPFHFSV